MINCVYFTELILTRQFNKRNLIFDRADSEMMLSRSNRNNKMEATMKMM